MITFNVENILNLGAIVFGGVWVYKAITTVLGRPERLNPPPDLMDYGSPYIEGDNAGFDDYLDLILQNREEANKVLSGKTIEVRYLADGFIMLRFQDYMNKWFMVGPDLITRLQQASSDFKFNITRY